MSPDDLYQLWINQARDEAEEYVQRAQEGYDRIVHKDSIYGRSLKAMLDLRKKQLEMWKDAPSVLPEPKS